MSTIKRDRWTEAEIIALPAGEHDYFDRKSGALLKGSELNSKCAKALSAFANSGGGHLILGVADDGLIDGVEPLHGNTPTREWMEQIIPNLLDYPLKDFRVHEVEPSTPTTIPVGKVVLVVDVGDSSLSPHQARPDKAYYYRVGSHSKPAPHFYLETLRNRLVRPSLEAVLIAIRITHSQRIYGGIFVETKLDFRIRNNGRVAAYKWDLSIDGMDGYNGDRVKDYKFSVSTFPTIRSRPGSIRLDDTILPSLCLIEEKDFGVQLRPKSFSRGDLVTELYGMISSTFELGFRVVTETSPGELQMKKLGELINYEDLIESLLVHAI